MPAPKKQKKQQVKMPPRIECTMPESHEAFMAVNGECPWCGEYDPNQGGMSVEDAEALYG